MSAPPEIAGLRPYTPDDLERVLEFAGRCAALTDFCGCLHPGDVAHLMSNACRGRDLDRHVHLYEAGGEIRALVLLYPPRYDVFDLVLEPSLRGTERETRLLAWGGEAMAVLMREAGSETQAGFDAMECDPARQDVLRGLGYQAQPAPHMIFTTRPLETPIPESALPDGFTVRAVAGEHEAALLAAVHSGAFGSKWTPDEYLRVMRTPGFDFDRELVVVAPDGRFAAFLVYWLDPITRSGLFEPVGCHVDFQRKGLTRALMYEGMRRMRARGMTTAIVKHATDNAASTALYRSAGFAPKHSIFDFRKNTAVIH